LFCSKKKQENFAMQEKMVASSCMYCCCNFVFCR